MLGDTAGIEDGGVRPVVFSASSVNAYLDCHLRWYFSYILNEDGETSEAQAVGIAVHDYAESRLRELNDTGMGKRPPIPAEHVAAVSPLLRVFDEEILPTYIKPLLVEASFQVEVNGIPFSGILDSLDYLPYLGERILRDLKTTGSRPSPGRYRFNMIGYYIGATELGREPDRMQLDYIVRTKKPYYWPEDVPLPTEDDLAWFASLLEEAAEGVAQGKYEPTGLGTIKCSYCPHKNTCGPYQRYQEATSPLRKEVSQ